MRASVKTTATPYTRENEADQSIVVHQKKEGLPWMTTYKVNFKRFVRTVLEKDLVELSRTSDVINASLYPFLTKSAISTFL